MGGDLLTEHDAALLAAWNATEFDFAVGETLVDAFGCGVVGSDAVALVFGGESVSYGELRARANRLARWLVDAGVGADVLVGVLMERSVEMVVSLHAIVTAGGAYVPLDPDVPDDRSGYMVDEADLSVVLTQESLRDRVPQRVDNVLSVDAERELIDRYDCTDLDVTVDPDSAAYVIYTSGSTGRPKGVINEHRGIVNRLAWMQSVFDLGPDDCVLQKTPFGFDVSVWELFWPFQVGARLAIAAPDGHRDPGYLIDEINTRAVTTVHFVPSMLRLFLNHPRAGTATTLKRVICSGEALTADLQDRFFDTFDNVELHNLYGPTEAAVDVTHWQCDPNNTTGTIPIGAPIANTEIHILDDQLQPVPIGTAAELHIGGIQVARGYLNRPELTTQRFIDNPHGPGRLYKTGDLARWRTDGNLEYLGRTDHQVKIRGNRVELGEIEATLLQHPNITTTAVTTHLTRSGSLQPIAHYSPVEDTDVDATELRSFLEARLPSYMIPNHYIAHDDFKITTNGKIDRKSLDAAFEARRASDGVGVAPRDPIERLLTEIWSEVLERDDVGVEDGFFELGGDSLQAASVVNRIQTELEEFIYVITAFTAPTIAEYAQFLRRDYPEAVARRFGVSSESPTERPERAFDEKLSELRAAVPSFGPFTTWTEGPPIPGAIFVLSPPRSGTSLLRVMLAGHPDLFAGSELQLLHFDTLQQRRRAFDGPFSLWREGTIRALMELNGVDGNEASELMDGYESEGLSAKDFYRVIHDAGGGRTIVDKSPSYALDRAALDNAEVGFEQPFYIHLVRDPHEMVHSFDSYHMDQVLFLEDHGLRGRELGELVWFDSHLTTLEFLAEIPDERQLRLRFEDLVADPRTAIDSLVTAAGIEFHDGMLRPYDDLEHKMVDGLHDDSTPMGDTRFLEHGRIDPAIADKWRRQKPTDVLDSRTWSLAEQFGYSSPAGQNGNAKPSRRSLAARQRRRRAGRS